jgi:high-affinity iron transporter
LHGISGTVYFYKCKDFVKTRTSLVRHTHATLHSIYRAPALLDFLLRIGIVIIHSARLPLRQLFSFTGILMLALAVVFAGKGVAALQEAGYIPINAVSFPRIDVLGIYPNLQGLLLQLGLGLLALLLWYGLPAKRAAAS